MLETLEQWGCETEKTMERFLDDKEFYQECYDLFIGGEGLEQLRRRADHRCICECARNERNSIQFGTGSYCEYIEQDRRAASRRQNRWCNGAI